VYVRAPLLGTQLQERINARQATAPKGDFPSAVLPALGFEINNLNAEI
jgi:hypothetical protein